MMRNFTTCLFAALLVLTYVLAEAEPIEGGDNIVFKNSSGALTEDSIYYARILHDKARRQGSVKLWVTLSMYYNLGDMEEGEMTAQAEAVEREFIELLGPLARQGKVIGLSRPLPIMGPGCAVTVTADGLAALVRDPRVLHMVERI